MRESINLRNYTALSSLLALLLLLSGESTLLAQAKPVLPLSERILDCSEPTLIFNDLSVVRSDIKNLFTDLGVGSLADSFLEPLENFGETGFDETAGAILYSNIISSKVDNLQLHVADADKIVQKFSSNADTKIVTGEFFILDKNLSDIPVARSFGASLQSAVTAVENEGRLLFIQNKDSKLSKQLLAAPLLNKRLDDTAKDIINRSGMSATWSIPKESWKDLGVPQNLTVYENELTDAEFDWIEQLADITKTVTVALVGVKYESKTVHVRSHAQFSHDKPLNTIVNFDKIKKEWAPDLGFEKEQLVFSAAIQMEAFRSSAAARVIPQIALMEADKNNPMKLLQGGMLRVFAELMGDSWNDLSVARIGMYLNDPEENAGQLALIGIADAKEGADVLTELRRMSAITTPKNDDAEPEQNKNEELLRLIEMMQSDDSNLANRSATRLVLAGSDAIALLKKIDTAGNAVLQRRVNNTLRRIKLRIDREGNGSEVIDPGFWTTLNPGLRWEENTGTVNEFASHTIHVTSDASKTPAEVEAATQMMVTFFGDQWNQIQVVAVNDRYVFLIGSDTKLLKKVVANVANDKRQLLQAYTDVGMTPVIGQVQVWVNALRATQVLRVRQIAGIRIPEESIDQHRCWVGLNIEPHAISVDSLIPVTQIQPFLRLAF